MARHGQNLHLPGSFIPFSLDSGVSDAFTLAKCVGDSSFPL